MRTDGQRNARAALDTARASFEGLDRAGTMHPDDVAARLVEAWQGMEQALRALTGSTVMQGVALVRELRQRNLLSLEDAHALVDFHAAAERARSPGYAPTPGDIAAARAGYDHLAGALSRDPAAGASFAGAPNAGPSGRPERDVTADATPVIVAPPSHDRQNPLAKLIVAFAVLVIVGAGVFYAMQMGGSSDELRRGRSAYTAGDRITAKNAFSAAASAEPKRAEPHIFLGRIAREEGDLPTASSHLRRAVELEPGNAIAQRELAAYLLATGQLVLARSFYERAIRLDPEDRNALGFMACTLHRMGRADLAQRFSQRAGPGAWDRCLQLPPPMPAQPMQPMQPMPSGPAPQLPLPR